MIKLIEYIKNCWKFYRKEKCNLWHCIKWTIDDVYVDFIAYNKWGGIYNERFKKTIIINLKW